jgi:hypothetical protein
MSTRQVTAAALAFIASRRISLAHAEGYEAACRLIPCPRVASADAIAAYSAQRVEAAKAAGYTAADGAELHRIMVAARADLLRAAAPMLRRPEMRALRAADAATQADAIVRALNVTA